MERDILTERRGFLLSSVAVGAALVIPATTLAKEDNEGVGPAEDLMREHGALNRILLIYEEGLRRLGAKSEVDPKVLRTSAQLIKDFIENYHEKLEEEFVFPRLKKAGKLVNLVNTLETQHKAGRRLTATIEKLSNPNALKNETDREKLKSSIEAFIRMYRPHESREDTVLFPEFHEMLGKKEYERLGEHFEDREHKLFGKEGFKEVVQQIEDLEKAYDIYDLSKFTPP